MLFGPGRQPSSAQITGREGPCGCYTCYWQLVPTLYVYFPNAPKNCYGIISADACSIEMAKLPDKGKDFCQKIKKEIGITSFKNCPEFAAACGPFEEKPPEEKKPECRKNSDSPNGKNCCDNMPERGSLYVGTKYGRTYSEPSTNSIVVDSLPSGNRVRYTNTAQVNGQTWYYIEPSGREKGWMSGDQLSCTRPAEPPRPRIIIPFEEGMKLFQGTAAHAHAARG